MYLVAGSVMTTPIMPPTVPNSKLGSCASSFSGGLITSEPARKQFTRSPTCIRPVMSRRFWSSTLTASAFLRATNMLRSFSAAINLVWGQHHK